MLAGRLHRIFARYADEALALERSPAAPLARGGRVDSIALQRGRLILRGITQGKAIALRLNRVTLREAQISPPDAGGMCRFQLDLPFEPGRLALLQSDEMGESTTDLPGFTAAQVRRARVLLWPRYIGTILMLLPVIWRWKRQGDLGAREIVKERLGLVPRSHAVGLEPEVLRPAPPRASAPEGVTLSVILPAYNAFELLCEALERAETHADLPLRLIVIEDCSSDPRVRPSLRDWAADPARRFPVHLLLNTENLGFIASVNRGLAEARKWPGDPVVLLNSDAMLPEAWASRLIAPLADPGVASVTPMSNDAEIFNVPVICQRNDLPAGLAAQIDRAAARLNPEAALCPAPTGVGFCMAMAPGFLAKVPEFDTGFGRGYGEETDWCQKTRALGGQHLGIGTLFVEHRGGTSFGQSAKQKLLERNGAEITRRYPAYDGEVQAFIRNDPMLTARLALALVWAAGRQADPVPVYLAHAMGGGAENDLRRRIAQHLAADGAAVVVRVGQGQRWRLELHSPFGVTEGLCEDAALVRALIAHLPSRRVIYSCGVGEREPAALPALLLALAGRGADPLPGGPQRLEVLVHDFFMISPSYTLLGQDRDWHGLPLTGTEAGEDPAHHWAPGHAGRGVTLAQWQAAWGRLMLEADKITAFSPSSRAIVAATWPGAAARIVVEPHDLLTEIPRIAPSHAPDGRPVIGVLGNIGVQKGAAVLQRLSQDLARDPRFKLVVIGQFDPDYRLVPPSRIHGRYEWRDLPGLVARYGISAWLIPSVWPETFSFTTHEALATGMPVLAFDLGAQGDAVRAAGEQGRLLARSPGGDLSIEAVLDALDQRSSRSR